MGKTSSARHSGESKTEQIWEGLTRAEWNYVNGYIQRVAEILRLRDWWIELDEMPCDLKDSDGAAISILYGKKYAMVRLGLQWATYANHRKRIYIAHELIHCHAAPPWHMVEDDLRRIVSPGEHRIFHSAFSRAMETTVDDIAMIVKDFLPEYAYGV
jgi:hypothetical protein